MDVESSPSLELPHQCRELKISEIYLATQNFDESLVIGRGGFGTVYKGTISNGAIHLDAAIKRLDSTSNQGALEFWNEVQMLSKLRHCNLVSLIGYCNDEQEMILVYEYMPHGTLEDHLHKFQSPLPWVRRLKICIGVARGLDYLHTGTGIKHGVIHRDVKSSNILLDDSWAAKLSDFGLSKLGPINQPSTHVSTIVKGTYGYLDPDYYATGRLTRKSDVYAFGVILLEVLSGKHAVDSSLDEEHWGLVNWAQESIKEGRLKQIVEYSIREKILPKCLREFGRLADRCLRSNPKQRPTMAEVEVCLDSILALQEKSSNTSNSAGMTIFGNKMPMFQFRSNGEKAAVGKTFKSVELYFETVGGESKALRRFEFGTINIATENFSENNRISQGGYCSMYKGMLQNGLRIAISKCDRYTSSQEYTNEVSLLVKLKHENLLQLRGYSIDGANIIYVLFWIGISEKNIILGVARALLYLHQHDVIYGNVTSGNILLDISLDPKLSDVGHATCLPIKETETECFKVEKSHGARAYLAPNHSVKGCMSTKAEVFSFGVLILEIINGCKMDGFDFRPGLMTVESYVRESWLQGSLLNMMDHTTDADSSSITRFIHIGMLCVQEVEVDRPTMEEVVVWLTNTSSLTLPLPKVKHRRRGLHH